MWTRPASAIMAAPAEQDERPKGLGGRAPLPKSVKLLHSGVARRDRTPRRNSRNRARNIRRGSEVSAAREGAEAP